MKRAGDVLLPFLLQTYTLTRTGSYALIKPRPWRPLVGRDRSAKLQH